MLIGKVSTFVADVPVAVWSPAKFCQVASVSLVLKYARYFSPATGDRSRSAQLPPSSDEVTIFSPRKLCSTAEFPRRRVKFVKLDRLHTEPRKQNAWHLSRLAMKRVIPIVLIFLACVLPLTAPAFGFIEFKDHTIAGPGGRYGVCEVIEHSTRFPAPHVRTDVCLGPVGFSTPFREFHLILGAVALAITALWAGLFCMKRTTETCAPPPIA